ncbi:MAG: hypothetical protein WC261_12545 [Synergistaceae bacterium]|jgi:hypothetical protein
MRTEIINGVKVTIIEDQQDMLEFVRTNPITFNVQYDGRTVTTTRGFE